MAAFGPGLFAKSYDAFDALLRVGHHRRHGHHRHRRDHDDQHDHHRPPQAATRLRRPIPEIASIPGQRIAGAAAAAGILLEDAALDQILDIAQCRIV
jgi:hypothetical protein